MEKQMSFEEAMERLNQVTALMERPGAALDELTSLYKEGRELYRFCSEKLDTAEKELQIMEADEE